MPTPALLEIPSAFDVGEDSLELPSPSSLSSLSSETFSDSDSSATTLLNDSTMDLKLCAFGLPKGISELDNFEADITTAFHSNTAGLERLIPEQKDDTVTEMSPPRSPEEDDLGDLGSQSIYSTPIGKSCEVTPTLPNPRTKQFRPGDLSGIQDRIFEWKRGSSFHSPKSPKPLASPSVGNAIVGLGLDLPEDFGMSQCSLVEGEVSPQVSVRARQRPTSPPLRDLSELPPLPTRPYILPTPVSDKPKKIWPRPRGYGVIQPRFASDFGRLPVPKEPRIGQGLKIVYRHVTTPAVIKQEEVSSTPDAGNRPRFVKSPLLALSPRISNDFGVYATQLPSSCVSSSRLASESQDSDLVETVQMHQGLNES